MHQFDSEENKGKLYIHKIQFLVAHQDPGTNLLIPEHRQRSDSINSQSSQGRKGQARAKRIIDSHYKDFSVLGKTIT